MNCQHSVLPLTNLLNVSLRGLNLYPWGTSLLKESGQEAAVGAACPVLLCHRVPVQLDLSLLI